VATDAVPVTDKLLPMLAPLVTERVPMVAVSVIIAFVNDWLDALSVVTDRLLIVAVDTFSVVIGFVTINVLIVAVFVTVKF
jgi:hypothetical protein